MNRIINAFGLAALLAGGCGKEADDSKKERTEIAIPSRECIDICGGKICYDAAVVFVKVRNRYSGLKQKKPEPENSIVEPEEEKLWGYSITAEGFEDYFILNKRMIFADECVFHRRSYDAEKLVLERLM